MSVPNLNMFTRMRFLILDSTIMYLYMTKFYWVNKHKNKQEHKFLIEFSMRNCGVIFVVCFGCD